MRWRSVRSLENRAIHASGAPPGWRRWWVIWWLLIVLSVPPAAIATAFQLQPPYVVLDIPIAGGPAGYFWWEEQISQLAYEDSWGVLYLRRQVGSAHPVIEGWQTAEEALAYFDRWLAGNGWTYTGPSFDRNPVLPESRFLKPGLWRHYRRNSDRNIAAVVAVWPIDSITGSFNVVLTTERPSWARRLWNALD